MANPRLLALAPAEDVWPVRAEDGTIVGALQVLGDNAVCLDGVELCAAMAHEVRNPLTGIQGFANLLQKDLRENDSRRDLVKKIISGVRTVNATVSNMLGFCRPRPLRTEPAEVRALMTSALELAGCTEHLDVAIDTARCETICCDPLQMQQALINLIKNAAEAMPGGGRLGLSARRRGEGARIIIADTGCGMDARTRANIFRPFFSTKAGGTGIGLALTRKIIQQHDGDMEIESDPGKGTRVILTLPGA